MAFARWLSENDFFSRMNRLQREMERMWSAGWSGVGHGSSVYPPINIYDDGESYIARAEIPGVAPEDINVTVTGNTLTIRGKREIEPAGEDLSYQRRERNSGEFRRAFTLPEQVDSSKVVAKSTDGVLEILLPWAERAKQHKVEIEAP